MLTCFGPIWTGSRFELTDQFENLDDHLEKHSDEHSNQHSYQLSLTRSDKTGAFHSCR